MTGTSAKMAARREGRGQVLILRALRFVETIGLAGLDGAPVALIAQVAGVTPWCAKKAVRAAFGNRRVSRVLRTGKDDGVPWHHHCYSLAPDGRRWLAWVDAQPDIAPDRWTDPVRFEMWRRSGVIPPNRHSFRLSPKGGHWPPDLRLVPTFTPF